MTELVLRTVKNLPVENIELDNNFVNLAKDIQLTTRNSVPWVANTAYTYSQILNFGSRFYLVTVGGTSGATGPSHTSGLAANGTLSLEFTLPKEYTAADVLDKIKLVDGSGSGLDADLLDGLSASSTIPTGTNKSSIVARDLNGDVFARNFVGTFSSDSGVALTGANTGFELGSLTVQNIPYLDFHSSGNNTDFDSRIIATGGTSIVGQGTLSYVAASHVFNGSQIVNSTIYSGINSNATEDNITLENTSIADTNVKSTGTRFLARDTAGTQKVTGVFRVTPVEGNVISSFMSWVLRSVDFVSEKMRLYGNGNLVLGSSLIDDGVNTLQINGPSKFTGTINVPTVSSGVSNLNAVNTTFAYNNFARLTGAGNYFTQQQIFTGNQATSIANAPTQAGAISIEGNGSGGAFMQFNRPGIYASYFGLDTDNQWKFGGYSAGAIAQTVLHSGNINNFPVNSLNWRNFGVGHTIFDASAALSPTGSTVDKTNSQQAWTPTYPTLMGWNGTNTFGVRVDSSRIADIATNSIGVGQTWQSVSRPLNVTFNNGTGKAIELVVLANRNAASTAHVNVNINGLAIPICRGTNSSGGNESSGSVIIPIGANYTLQNPGEPLSSLFAWELR